MTQNEVANFANAYLRGSLEWDAYVAGGAAFLFNGHTFETKAV